MKNIVESDIKHHKSKPTCITFGFFYITEILLKVALNTINLSLPVLPLFFNIAEVL